MEESKQGTELHFSLTKTELRSMHLTNQTSAVQLGSFKASLRKDINKIDE